MNLLEAERAVTTGTIEMGMLFLIIMIIFTIVMADVVFQCPTAVIHHMDKAVKKEEGKGAGNGAFIYCWQQLLQPRQRQHFITAMQLFKDEQARGGGLDVVMLQIVEEGLFVHDVEFRV